MNNHLIGIDEPEGSLREAPIVRNKWDFEALINNPSASAHFERMPIWMYGLSPKAALSIAGLADQKVTSGVDDAIRQVLIEESHPLILAQHQKQLALVLRQLLDDGQIKQQLNLLAEQLQGTQVEHTRWFRTNLALKRMEERAMIAPLLREILNHREKGPTLNLTTWGPAVTAALGDANAQHVKIEHAVGTPFGNDNALTVMHHPGLKPNADEGMDIRLLEKVLKSTRPGGHVIVITPDRTNVPGSRESLRRSFRVEETLPTAEQYHRKLEQAHIDAKVVRADMELQAHSPQARAILAELLRFMIPPKSRPRDTDLVETWLSHNTVQGFFTHSITALLIERGPTFVQIPKLAHPTKHPAAAVGQTAKAEPLPIYTPETLQAASPLNVMRLLDLIGTRSNHGTDDFYLRRALTECGVSRDVYRYLITKRSEIEALMSSGGENIKPIVDAYPKIRIQGNESPVKRDTRLARPATTLKPLSEFDEFAAPITKRFAIAEGAIDPDIEDDVAHREPPREERSQTRTPAAPIPRSIPIISASSASTSHVRSSTPLPAMNTSTHTPRNSEPAEVVTMEVHIQRLEERAAAIGIFERGNEKTDADRKAALTVIHDAIKIGLDPNFLLQKMGIGPQSVTTWKRKQEVVSEADTKELQIKISSLNEYIRPLTRLRNNEAGRKYAIVAVYRLYQIKVDTHHAGYQVRLAHQVAEDNLVAWNTEYQGLSINQLMRNAGMEVEADEADEVVTELTSATASHVGATLASTTAPASNNEGNGQVVDARPDVTAAAATVLPARRDAPPETDSDDDSEANEGSDEALPTDVAAMLQTVTPIGRGWGAKASPKAHIQIAAVYQQLLNLGYGFDELLTKLDITDHKFRKLRQDSKLPYNKLSEADTAAFRQCEDILRLIQRTGSEAYTERQARAAVICARYYRMQGMEGFNKKVMELGRMSPAKISIWIREYLGQSSQSLLPDLYPPAEAQVINEIVNNRDADTPTINETLVMNTPSTDHATGNGQPIDEIAAASTVDEVIPAAKPVDVPAAINEQSSQVRNNTAAVVDPTLAERIQRLETTVQEQGEVINRMQQTITELHQALHNRAPDVSVHGSTTIDAGNNSVQVERTPFNIAITINNNNPK